MTPPRTPSAGESGEGTDAPWQSPSLLPANPLIDQWGALLGGDIVPKSLDDLLSMVRAGPGPVLWNGKPQNEVPAFVAPPGAPRLMPLVESAAFQPTVLESDGKRHEVVLREQRLLLIVLSVVSALFVGIGMARTALLPAIYAAGGAARCLDAWLALRRMREFPATYLASSAAQARYAYWLNAHARTPWHTYGLVAAWVLVAAVEVLVARSHTKAALDVAVLVKALVPAEPWRLLTGPMMHGSVMHILMNVAATLSLGVIVERTVHRHLTIPIWCIGALGGSLFSWAATSGSSLGASGGLMALFGFLLVMAWRRAPLLPPDFRRGFLVSLAVTALFGAMAWQVIDNAAHAGGLLTGGALGAVAFRSPQGSLPWKDRVALRMVGHTYAAMFIGLTLFTVGKLLGWT